ncbi:MAG: NapC/NirT family cytochrome c [Deltaproteobacteria bacterium]|jgi:nitrate/TMAO reductase-like tetraheme cytochrome c subunit|nr:NapC/NirT family cytochrome c [Deltaproteobacteria bacterium]
MGEHKSKIRPAALGAAVLAALLAFAGYTLRASSSMEFCSATCHEMGPQAEELRYSSHALDAQGKPISCAQCHIPPGFGPRYLAVKAYSGIKDLVVHLVQSPDPATMRRAPLQPVARRFVDDANCLACHADLYKDAKGEKTVSDLGRLAHDAYLGKNGQAKSNCAGCHINIAHLPAFDRRLLVNQAFAGRISLKEARR